MIVPSTSWTMDQRGAKRVEITGLKDKWQTTAVFCGTIQGDFLPVQVVYKGTTQCCHPRFKFPPGWHVTHSKNHWLMEQTMIEYIHNVIIPYVSANRESDDQAALVNILVCYIPPYTTDKLQPMDLTVNKPAQDFLKQKFQEWYSDQILKQLDSSTTTNQEL